MLNTLFNVAISCGKRVRGETAIGRKAVSGSSVAIELGKRRLGSLAGKDVLIIGAGKMAHLCLKQLLREPGAGKIMVTNRDPAKLDGILPTNPRKYARTIEKVDFSDRHRATAAADFVIVATSALEFILTEQELQPLRTDNPQPLCIIDISVPRNVDPALGELAGIDLHDGDDIVRIVQANLADRRLLIDEAELIVQQRFADFQVWMRAFNVMPTLSQLREKLETIAVQITERASAGGEAQGSHCPEDKMAYLGKAIVAQILHEPTIKLKSAQDNQVLCRQAETLRTLFSLDSNVARSN